MYRGSGDLLDRNYFQYFNLVKELRNTSYFEDRNDYDEKTGLYEHLIDEGDFSELTIQKVLSGVYGCSIPLDDLVKKGFRIWRKSTQGNRKVNGLSAEATYYDSLRIIEISIQLKQPMNKKENYPLAAQIVYPINRLLDVYFYWIGYCSAVLEWLDKYNDKSIGKRTAVEASKFAQLCRVFNDSRCSIARPKEVVHSSIWEEYAYVIEDIIKKKKENQQKKLAN